MFQVIELQPGDIAGSKSRNRHTMTRRQFLQLAATTTLSAVVSSACIPITPEEIEETRVSFFETNTRITEKEVEGKKILVLTNEGRQLIDEKETRNYEMRIPQKDSNPKAIAIVKISYVPLTKLGDYAAVITPYLKDPQIQQIQLDLLEKDKYNNESQKILPVNVKRNMLSESIFLIPSEMVIGTLTENWPDIYSNVLNYHADTPFLSDIRLDCNKLTVNQPRIQFSFTNQDVIYFSEQFCLEIPCTSNFCSN
jgi:hypothetical protein